MNGKGSSIIIIAFIIIIGIAIFLSLPFNRIPDGVPANYFERIELVEDTDANVYVYSDAIDFNGDFNPISVTNIDEIPLNHFLDYNFLIIDMNVYDEDEFGTVDQIDGLYKVQCFYIIIVNNGDSQSTELNQLFTDSSSNLITLSYDTCHGSYYTETNVGEFPSFDMLMYAILDKMCYIIEGV
ncbi:MAG: hypothetical protein ABH890_00055 [Bacillota bacterium]